MSNDTSTKFMITPRRTNIFLAILACLWLGILVAHVMLKGPWLGDANSSLKTCGYLIAPALLLVILSLAWVVKKDIKKDYPLIEAAGVRSCVPFFRALNPFVPDLGVRLCPGRFVLLGLIFAFAVACITLAFKLDTATNSQMQKTFAIAEAVCLSIVFLLCAIYVGIGVRSAREIFPDTELSESQFEDAKFFRQAFNQNRNYEINKAA